MNICTIDDCARAHHAKGMCSHHYNRAYYRADVENQRARARRWGAQNPEKVRARNSRRDKAAMAAAQRQWYAANRLRAIASAANAKARKLGLPGELTGEGLAARIAFFGGRCWICTASQADSIDHVIPLGAGGPNVHANIRPACLSCNTARSWDGRRG